MSHLETYIRKARQKSPENKSYNLNLFKLYYKEVTGERTVPSLVLQDAVDIQRKFFRENPDRMYCDHELYKQIPEIGEHDVTSPGLALVDQLVQEDIISIKK